MKKTFVKILSVLLVVVILATSLPITVFATDDNVQNGQTVSTDMGDMSITATNSFGEMLTDSLNEQTEEMDSGHYISDVEYDSNSVVVSFVTKQDCTIRVAAYEEDTDRMITSASVSALAEDTEAVVEFVDELPDYFVLKAFMLDENSAPLCKAYTCNEETKVYAEFLATTTEDFPEDKVINLDEDETTNFLVMSEETETVTTNGKTNILISYNAETGIYTFGNIDEQIQSLSKDDIFYFDNGNVDELTFIKVAAIDIDGTTAYITEAETSINEVFDVVKIYNEMASGEFSVDENEELEEGVTYLGSEKVEENDDEISTYAWESEKSVTYNHKFKIEKEKEAKKPNVLEGANSVSGKIKVKGTVGISVKGTFKYYISKKFSEIEFVLTPSAGFNFEISGKGRFEVEFKKIDISPCKGVFVHVKPRFVVETSVKATIDATLKFSVGFGYDSIDGFVNKTKNPTFKPEIKIEGSIFVGVDLQPDASVISEKLVNLKLKTEIGAKIKAKLTTNLEEKHLCDSCLDGNIDLVGKITGTLTFGENTKWSRFWTIKMVDIKIDIIDFYYSYTLDEFGWGKCKNYIITSGKCGDNLEWNFDDSSGTLTVSGTGEMYDYDDDSRPWHDVQSGVYSIIIKDGVTSIGDEAFGDTGSLKNLIIGNTVTEIGEYAFAFCEALEKVTIPDSVIIIGDWAFSTCWNLNSVVLGDGVTKIGDYAFYECYSLTDVSIGDNVIDIGVCAFANCNIANVTIPNSVKIIGKSAFLSCPITNIIIPESITTIGDYAFVENVVLTEIKVDEKNKYYSSDEYGVLFNKDKTKLIQYPIGNTRTNYTIPSSVITIGSFAFEACDNLTSITIPGSVTTIGDWAFHYCDSLTSVTIGDGVTTIGSSAFGDCDNLTSITIPGSVTTIGDWAFSYCYRLKSIIIPDSVTIIGDYAFVECSNLTNVYYGGTEEQWNGIIINRGNSDLTSATIHYNSTGANTYSLRPNQATTMSFNAGDTNGLTVYNAKSTNAVSGNEYVVIVLKNSTNINSFTDNDILYINQKKAEADGEISFAYIPKTDEDSVVYIIGVFSDSDSVKQEQITPVNPNEPIYNYTLQINTPSTTSIRHKDGIKLHTSIEGTAPAGSYVVWTANNENFKTEEINNGDSLQIVSDKNGYTTITATLYDAGGNELARDTIEMRSKAGFFDKIGSFFRSLFGGTKIHES